MAKARTFRRRLGSLLAAFNDRIAHYPVLFFGAVGLTIKWRYPHMSLAAEGSVGAWILFLQTITSSSRKGLAEAKAAARNETLADVASLTAAD